MVSQNINFIQGTHKRGVWQYDMNDSIKIRGFVECHEPIEEQVEVEQVEETEENADTTEEGEGSPEK